MHESDFLFKFIKSAALPVVSYSKKLLPFTSYLRLVTETSFKNLTSSRSSNEAKIAEFSHLVLHNGGMITKFTAVVFIITSSNGYDGPVGDFTQCHNSESNRQ